MDLVAQRPRIVPVINSRLTRYIAFIVALLHGGIGVKGHFSVSVVEMGTLEECDAIRTQTSIVPRPAFLKGTLVLRLTVETAIAGLEVRTGNVGGGQLIESSVDNLARLKGVLELHPGAHSRVELFLLSDHDRVGGHLRFILQALLVGVAQVVAEVRSCVRESILVVRSLRDLVRAESIVSPKMGPGHLFLLGQ